MFVSDELWDIIPKDTSNNARVKSNTHTFCILDLLQSANVDNFIKSRFGYLYLVPFKLAAIDKFFKPVVC